MSLVGEVDTAVAGLLSEAVDWLAADTPPGVLIDLAGVTFAGSALLNFFGRLSHAMPADGELVVWRSSPSADLVLRTGALRRSVPRSVLLST
ncbi:STAS domain-containing protein [Cryptosporangium arvum]|uniref:STAS domain-containing protein n=1 Tax=Cryptosporangium arvum TaxID=80871 RepID=UPI0004AD331C|nr:STAS domain-containing protein [Cryptosporangium arvum]